MKSISAFIASILQPLLINSSFTPDVLISIDDCISNGLNNTDYPYVAELLKSQSINTFNAETMITNIKRTKFLANLNSIDTSSDIAEIVSQKIGRLF